MCGLSDSSCRALLAQEEMAALWGAPARLHPTSAPLSQGTGGGSSGLPQLPFLPLAAGPGRVSWGKVLALKDALAVAEDP